MKFIYLIFAFLIFTFSAFSQGSESFDNFIGSSSEYTGGTFIGNNGVSWSYTEARLTSSGANSITGKTVILRKGTNDLESSLSATLTGGIGSFSVDLKKAFTSDASRQVALFINGQEIATSVSIGNSGEPTATTFSVNNINIPNTFTLKLVGVFTSQISIDNISWTGYVDTTPPTVSTDPLNNATDVATNAAVTFSFGEEVRKVNNSALTNANAATLFTFKETDSNGEAVPFTTTVSADKTSVTLTPTENLRGEQTYYVALSPNAIEDISNNVAPATTSTFTTVKNKETFENSTLPASYNSGSFVGQNGITWNYVSAQNEDIYGIDGKGAILRDASSKITSGLIEGGINSLSIDLKKAFSSSTLREVRVYLKRDYEVDFSLLTPVGGTYPSSNADATFQVTFEELQVGGNFSLEIRNEKAAQIVVDNITWSSYIDRTAPTASLSYNAGSGNNSLTSETTVPVSSSFVVSFDDAVRNLNNTSITNGDLVAFLSLKEQGASGKAVPFSVSINAAKTEITLTPDSPLLPAETYFLELKDQVVEDKNHNAVAGISATFQTPALVEDFSGLANSGISFGSYNGNLETFTGNNQVIWEYLEARGEDAGGSSDYPIDGLGLLFNSTSSSLTSSIISGGAKSVSVKVRKAFTGTGFRQVKLSIVQNGMEVETISTAEFGNASGADATIYNLTLSAINVMGDFQIKVTNLKNTQVTIDDIAWAPNRPTYISQLRGELQADGTPASSGPYLVKGTLLGPNFHPGTNQFDFALNDETGSLKVYNNGTDLGISDWAEGDNGYFYGILGHQNGNMTLTVSKAVRLTTGNSLPAAVSVASLGEETESKLVTLDRILFPDPSQWLGSAANTSSFYVDFVQVEGTGHRLFIDADNPLATVEFDVLFGSGATEATITGLGGQQDLTAPYISRYTLQPYSASSISSATSGAAPSQPANLLANAAGATKVNLSWTDASGEDGYIIVRIPSGGDYEFVGTVGANVTSYQDTTAKPGTSYTYLVRAFKS